MGKGALAPCPPSTSDDYPEWWARFRFAHPTIPVVVIASASEAIHRAAKQVWIASSLSLLAMTLMEFPDSNFKQLPTRLRVLAARRARSFARTLSLEKRGSRECRVRAAPAVSRAKIQKEKRTRAYRFSGNTPAFPAQWLYGLYRAPRRRIRLVTVAAGLMAGLIRSDRTHHRQLGTSNGCRDHTVLPYALAPFVLRAVARSRKTALRTHLRADAAASTASPPHVRDDRDTPLLRAGMSRAGSADLPDGTSGIFS
ncbi:hypothetical protein V1289_006736 [Bradyrhizobium sp. AZCC 2289]